MSATLFCRTNSARWLTSRVTVVKKRVPLFIGVTSVNSREAVAKIKMIDGSGADGILLGVPYYFPSSVEQCDPLLQ